MPKCQVLMSSKMLRFPQSLCRLSNRGVVLQVQPVIEILLGNPNAAWHKAEPEVIISLVNTSAQLALDHLTHRQSVSLLPSTEVLISPATGPDVDKLDNSAWLLQLLSLVIQMLQNSATKLPENKGDEIQAGNTVEIQQAREPEEDQDTSSSCSSNPPLRLTDKLVARREVFLCLLECLNQCSGDKQGVLKSGVSLSQEKFSADVKVSGKPASVKDGMLQILSVVQGNVSELGVLVDGIMAYFETPKIDNVELVSTTVQHLSDPLLWLLFKVLNSSQAITQFYDKGESCFV